MDLNKRKSISYAKYGYLFILPFFIVYLFFQIYPLCYTFYLSTQSNGDLVTESVGIDNFKILVGGQATTTPGHEIAGRAAKSADAGKVAGCSAATAHAAPAAATATGFALRREFWRN